MPANPSLRAQNVWPSNGGQDYLQLIGPGGEVFSWIDYQGIFQGNFATGAYVKYNVVDYGATGLGAVDDASAIMATITAASKSSGTVYFPTGVYLVNSTIVIPSNVKIVLDPSAIIRAGLAMTYLMESDSVNVLNGWIQGGQLDCYQLATNGLFLRQYQHFSVSGMTVANVTGTGFILGDSNLGGAFEAYLTNCRVFNDQTTTVQSGSKGVSIPSNSTDNRISQLIVVGQETGVSINSSTNHCFDVHCWAYAASGGMKVCFDDTGNANTYDQCLADTPTQYGWHCHGFSAVIQNSQAFVGVNGGAMDNTVVGIQCDQGQPFLTISNTSFIGNDVTHRMAQDVAGINNWIGTTFIGINEAFVVTKAFQNLPAFTVIPSIQVADVVLTGATPGAATGQVTLGVTTATSASAGSNGDVPAQVDGYLVINVGGAVKKIPYYPT